MSPQCTSVRREGREGGREGGRDERIFAKAFARVITAEWKGTREERRGGQGIPESATISTTGSCREERYGISNASATVILLAGSMTSMRRRRARASGLASGYLAWRLEEREDWGSLGRLSMKRRALWLVTKASSCGREGGRVSVGVVGLEGEGEGGREEGRHTRTSADGVPSSLVMSLS
jgi:hypothetical protein